MEVASSLGGRGGRARGLLLSHGPARASKWNGRCCWRLGPRLPRRRRPPPPGDPPSASACPAKPRASSPHHAPVRRGRERECGLPLSACGKRVFLGGGRRAAYGKTVAKVENMLEKRGDPPPSLFFSQPSLLGAAHARPSGPRTHARGGPELRPSISHIDLWHKRNTTQRNPHTPKTKQDT